MSLRDTLIKLHWLLSSQFGINPLIFLKAFRGIPRYSRNLGQFRKDYSGKFTLMPCLHDWQEEGGTTKSEYFWQDLLIAQKIFDAKPQLHVDIGSRVDGFVAHVASFREIEVFDVRPITTEVPGVIFKQADLMHSVSMDFSDEYCDSLSCLHAIEHFGLGRYGDPINPLGYERGIANMAKLLQPGGCFYLSTPIGQERVEFNANRVFDPRTIIQCAEVNKLYLKELIVIGARGVVRYVQADEVTLMELTQAHYNLGIYIFEKMDREHTKHV